MSLRVLHARLSSELAYHGSVPAQFISVHIYNLRGHSYGCVFPEKHFFFVSLQLFALCGTKVVFITTTTRLHDCLYHFSTDVVMLKINAYYLFARWSKRVRLGRARRAFGTWHLAPGRMRCLTRCGAVRRGTRKGSPDPYLRLYKYCLHIISTSSLSLSLK